MSSSSDSQAQYSEALQLDEPRLQAATSSDQGEVFVIEWLSKAEQALTKADVDTIKSSQSAFEAAVLKLACPTVAFGKNEDGSITVAPNTAVPRPGRPTRRLLARCVLLIFRRIDSRSLFDLLQNLGRVAGEDAKGKTAEREVRVAALYILGEVFGSLGQQIMSLFNDIINLTQKVLKQASHPVILRYHALLALQKTLNVAGKSLGDQVGKDLIKSLRQGLSDRAGAVVRGCADCILAVAQHAQLITTRNEVENLVSTALKAIETADFVTKRALSRAIAGLLASTQVKQAPPAPAPSKKTSKKKKEGAAGADDDSDDDDAVVSAAAAAASAPRAMMTPVGMLDQLSLPFLRGSANRKTRAALLDVYATLFETLGSAWVNTNYAIILKHLIDDLPNHSRGSSLARADVLIVRIGVSVILRKLIGEHMLGEQAQVLAIQEICVDYLKKWPAVMPEQQPPSKTTLTLALAEISGLLVQLGSVPPQVLDAAYDPLIRCLAHPSHSVQIQASWCLKTLCQVSPVHLSPTLASVLELLNRDLTTLANGGGSVGIGQLSKRANGHAKGLAALISVIPQRPLYTSFAISSKVLSLAIQLLKNSGNHDLSVSAVEISVAWTLVDSLMSLGPNFVRLHLPQLLILWRNSLPKPTSKDTEPGPSIRSDAEWSFLLHVRECTLTSILAFLLHNGSTLVTLDTARRIVALLSNSLAFVDAFAAQNPHLLQEQTPGSDRSTLSLLDREFLLRRRLFQCLTVLAHNPAMEPMQAGLIKTTIQAFADPDRYIGSSAQAAIAASAGNFTSVWEMADGYAFGVTSLQRDAECFVSDPVDALRACSATTRADLLNRDFVETQLDALQRRPVLGAAEHDELFIYSTARTSSSVPSSQDAPHLGASAEPRESAALSPPGATGVVDAAIQLFTALLPYQERDIQVAAIEAMLAHTKSTKLDKNPGRKQAIQTNVAVAILGALRVATQGGTGANGKRPSGFNNDRLSSAIKDLLQDALLQADPALRAAASEAYGKLAAVAGSQALSSQVQFLVDQIVGNRDPDARAGCALAFGSVYKEVGGLAAGPLTKTIVNVLMSLSSDPHPTVHYNALAALRIVVDSASLSYSPYVASTLGMLVKLYMLDTHEPEGGSAGSVNLRADLPAHQAVCRVVNALIGVLGPDLQESARVRSLIHCLLSEFSREADPGVVVESTKALQHFGLFAAQFVDVAAWIEQLRRQLAGKQRTLKLAATTAFYQLVQREALAMSRIGGDQLVEEFFAQLDEDPKLDGAREVILSWLQKTADLAPSGWIDLCQRIMSAAPYRQNATDAAAKGKELPSLATMLQDEEAAAIDLGNDTNTVKLNATGGSRWRTQLFSLRCLHQVFVTVRQAGKLEHFSTPPGAGEKGQASPQRRLLMSNRVVDLIRMAFTASTSANIEIRLEGLVVLRDVIESFKLARDPDFDEALLLEQHQAPIAAALTPAFLADSTPEVLAAAVQVCAVFVSSGVIKEVSRMGRILKQLVSALDSCMQPTMTQLGDVKDLSQNANAMLKIAVFTAWAELQTASATQSYLVDVVKPHVARIVPYWIACLREYAKIRSDPEMDAGGAPGGPGPSINASLDSQYAGLAREVVLPYHERSWHTILQAVTGLLHDNDARALAAMDGEINPAAAGSNTAAAPPKARSEPCLFFFVLYGLAFEALATRSSNSVESVQEGKVMRISLRAMTALSKPQVAGSALLQDTLFSELCNLWYRLVMTEPPAVQISVLETIGGMAASYGKLLLSGDDEATAEAGKLPNEAKLSQCLRVVVCVLQNVRTSRGSVDEKTALLRVAYSAYIGIVGLYPKAVQEDLFAVGFYTYAETLKDETSEQDLLAPSLSSLKNLCERSAKSVKPNSDVLQRAIHGLLSQALQHVDDLRTRAGRIALNKTKNSLLAVVVVLTSIPINIKVSQAVAEHACYLIVQKLLTFEEEVEQWKQTATSKGAEPQQLGEGVEEIGLTAVNCARTVVLASSRGNASLLYCVGQLLPGLIEFVCRAGPLVATSPVNARGGATPLTALRGALDDVIKTMAGLISTLPSEGEFRAKALTIILPTLLVLLSPSPAAATELHTFTVRQLITLAGQHAAAFKEATAALDVESKALLENAIRAQLGQAAGADSAVASAGRVAGEQTAAKQEKSSIALKSFGS
ncbi:related to LAA1-AP-1 accessory protein involved in TGN-endosome transport [Ustilago bromivora]|uniref:Related to LAA1 - AP-1 accessory protein involved in TGN-endosome transport n=1 Tax=Ustilago bromivora TaxID=307758 RepID=A0A1K0H7L5_9BASI|nr:related to LAA1-AP-1 accessory protein involved in TGN-endosome transport [Ustilago bromivora]SYW79805.1 related to LAA1 - AP-1 accessory protein involved in TGN-endosome transport [Ustilago bromivora]